MVGKEYEQGGIIKHGAMMINAISNSTVPHLTVIMGASYGAGNYGMNGRADDPRFLFTWPSAKSAVMGPAQLAGVLEIVAQQSGSIGRRGWSTARRWHQPLTGLDQLANGLNALFDGIVLGLVTRVGMNTARLTFSSRKLAFTGNAFVLGLKSLDSGDDFLFQFDFDHVKLLNDAHHHDLIHPDDLFWCGLRFRAVTVS
jgi:hypothetical protein